MPNRVLIAADARQDMQVLYGYLATHDSIAAADRILSGLEIACATLAENPARGRIPMEMRLLGIFEFREVLFKSYRIVYRVEDGDVIVYGIADGRRNMQSFLYRRLVR
jgi:toxin ParE1/3/4